MVNECILVTPELIRAAQRGNLYAYNCLVSACQDEIYSVICRLAPLKGDHEYIAQKVIERIYRELPTYHYGDFRLWLLKNLVKTCRPFMLSSRSPSDVDRSLHGCLAVLPPNLRLVIVLVDMEGLSYTQAAMALGIPRWMVCRHLARARQRIIEIHEGCLESSYA